MDIENKFIESLGIWGIGVSKYQLFQFESYYQELISMNEKLNLTSITDKKDVYTKHFLDSISSCQLIDYNNQAVADIGTGAGFPGIPLKIIFPSIRLVCIDSSKKKIEALKYMCSKIKIEDCEFISDNIENIGRGIKRGSQDIVVVRAVSTISTILEYGTPLLKTSGRIVIYKGPNVDNEVENSAKAEEILNVKTVKNIVFQIPFSDITRKIIVVEKTSNTPDKYPRKTGIPKKKPL